MVSSQPHFLLFSRVEDSRDSGVWHFLLESMDGETIVEASDNEPELRGERLELLAVVRGLEALDQPSRVTLVTSSRRISRGFRFGLDEWRSNGWQWERDGRWVPIKNGDLWQRVDRALKFHRVKCRRWRADGANTGEIRSEARSRSEPAPSSDSAVRPAQALKHRLTAAFRALFGPSDASGDWSTVPHLSN